MSRAVNLASRERPWARPTPRRFFGDAHPHIPLPMKGGSRRESHPSDVPGQRRSNRPAPTLLKDSRGVWMRTTLPPASAGLLDRCFAFYAQEVSPAQTEDAGPTPRSDDPDRPLTG